MGSLLNILMGMANGSPYSPELNEVIQYANSQGYTLPSADQLAHIDNALIIPLKAAGLWNTHDCLYALKNDGSAGFAGINLINPAINSGIPAGWVSDVGGRSLNTGYQPSGSRNYKINSASVISISVLVTGNNTRSMLADGNNYTISDSNGSISYINAIGFVALASATGTIYQHGFVSGSTLTFFRNGISGSSSTGTPTLPGANWIVGHTMEASSQVAIAGIGAAMANATIKSIYENWFNNVP